MKIDLFSEQRGIVPVILAGGRGERFWPLSRRGRPKQFLSFGGGRSLLQATADRLLPLAGGWDQLWVITAADLAGGVRQQLPDLANEHLLIEPEGRDTAPAIAWASLEVARRHGDGVIAGFFPSDHWIADEAAFTVSLKAAAALAARDELIVTLGIVPAHAATGYGYIEQGDSLAPVEGMPVYRVARFTEKPDRAVAEQFLASGRYYWNGGMFVSRVDVMLDELRRHAPEILEPIEREGMPAYRSVPRRSVDYALMEHTDRAAVLPAGFGWDDLGEWNAIERLYKGDAQNTDLSPHLALDTTGAIVYATGENDVVVTIGVEDLVIVRDGAVTLVAHKDRAQEIKQALALLQDDPRFKGEL